MSQNYLSVIADRGVANAQQRSIPNPYSLWCSHKGMRFFLESSFSGTFTNLKIEAIYGRDINDTSTFNSQMHFSLWAVKRTMIYTLTLDNCFISGGYRHAGKGAGGVASTRCISGLVSPFASDCRSLGTRRIGYEEQ